jgi:ribosomal RNA-processing protein 17
MTHVLRTNTYRARKKLEIKFSEDARVDFLTGFHKRKLQRKKDGHLQFMLTHEAKQKEKRDDVRKEKPCFLEDMYSESESEVTRKSVFL